MLNKIDICLNAFYTKLMQSYGECDEKIIFVDCFNTVILRNTSKKIVFQNWAKALEKEYHIHWKKFYCLYKKTNFGLCFKKIFSSGVLQENFDVVLKKMFRHLFRWLDNTSLQDFLETAKRLYWEQERDCHEVNQNFIQFLTLQKSAGKRIYIVSDFYCSSSAIKDWLTELGVNDLFTDIFSSNDFGKEKSTRGLYKCLLKNLQIPANDVLMLGDNFWSDVLMARSCGLHAKQINHKRENKNGTKNFN